MSCSRLYKVGWEHKVRLLWSVTGSLWVRIVYYEVWGEVGSGVHSGEESCFTLGVVFWATTVRNDFLVVRQAHYFSSAEAQLRLQRMKCRRVPCDFRILRWLAVLWIAANQEEPFTLLVPQLKPEIVESILSAFETCQFVTFISYSFLVFAEPTVCFLTPKILVFVDRM